MARLMERIKKIDFLKWSAVLFSISFSFGIAMNSIGFFLFSLVAVFITVNDFVQKRLKFHFKMVNVFLIVLFIIIGVRELTIDSNLATGVAFYYLAFLVLPLFIGFQSSRIVDYLPIILKAFLIGTLINVCTNIAFAIYRGIIINEQGINFWYFTYGFFAEPFGVQPIYLGNFYVFSLLILNHIKVFRKHAYFYYLSFFTLTLGVFLLAARNAIVCMAILIPAYLLLQRKISIKKMLMIFGILGVCFVFAIQNPIIKNRILKVNKKGNFYSGTSLRTSIWKSAYEASKENFVWGSGEKKGNELLMKEYEERKLKIPLKYKYHAHNQFLQTIIQYGIIGLIVLLASLLWPLAYTFSQKEYLGLFWLFLFAITSLTESVFTRQWGVFSFAFFTSLFMLGLKKIDSN